MNTYHKFCTKCKISKSGLEFQKDITKKDGLTSSCKTCVKKWRDDNKEKISIRREGNKEYHRQYYQDNKESISKRKSELHSLKKKTNLNYKLKCNIQNLILISIQRNGYSKKSRTHEILGCSYEEFKTYIENQFLEGMSWNNRTEWHLDHITPISWGQTEEEIIALNHYTNFQPLWAIDNFKKGNRFSG